MAASIREAVTGSSLPPAPRLAGSVGARPGSSSPGRYLPAPRGH